MVSSTIGQNSPNLTKALNVVALLGAALAISACAKVSIKKVGDPDGEEGLRYYMPRPYVMVHEPFVVASDSYVVGGQLSVDGQHVLITDWLDDETLSEVLKSTKGRWIPASSVLVSPASGTGEAQGAEEDEVEPPIPDDSQGDAEDKEPVSGGRQTLSMINDNSAYAVTPLKRYMDVIWLPDFSEQYVVTGRGGLGNSSIEMGMGQGWNLQSLDVEVDNSGVIDPLMSFYEQTVGSLSKVVQTKLGVLPTPLGGDEAQGAEELGTAVSFGGGTPVSVKVTAVKMAAPGLYPVLKESEFNQISDVRDKSHILVPVPPLTRIAFNVYEVVVIEAATSAGDSALRMHQYPSQWDKPITGVTVPQSENPAAQLKAFETALNQDFGGDDSNRWEVSLDWNPGTSTVAANLRKVGNPVRQQDAAVLAVRRLVINRGNFNLEGDRVVVATQ